MICMGDHVIMDERQASSSRDRDELPIANARLGALARTPTQWHDAEIVAMVTRRVGARRSAGREDGCLRLSAQPPW